MQTRSKSVPKISNIEYIRKAPPAVQSLPDRISSRVYGDKPKLPKLNLFAILDKPPLAHLHKQKSFDQITQSSPTSRVKMLQKARLYRKENDSMRIRSSQSIQSSGIHSVSRIDRSTEILSQAQMLVLKEQGNKEEIFKANKEFSGKIIESIKGINRKLSFAGIPGIKIIKKLKRKNKTKVLGVKN